MSLSGRHGALIALAVLTCCGGTRTLAKGRLSTLEAQHQEQVERLEAVRAQIRAAELEAERAHARAEFEKCRAGVEQIRAQVAARESQCMQRISRANECRASKSSKTGGGCLLGAVAAVVSGGALAPWVIGGCAAGAVYADAKEGSCAVPSCAARINVLDAEVLAESGRTAYPRCGGESGLALRDGEAQVTSVRRIGLVGNHSAAAEAGIRPGDLLVAVNRHRVSKTGIPASAMGGVRDGQLITFSFVRDRRLHTSRGRAGHFDSRGTLRRDKVLMGIKHEPYHGPAVRYVDAAAVERASGPAVAAGIQVGDVLVAIDGKRVESAAQAFELIDQHAPYTLVEVRVARKGAAVVVSLEIPPRATEPVSPRALETMD